MPSDTSYLDKLSPRRRAMCEWLIRHGIDPRAVPEYFDMVFLPGRWGRPNRWRLTAYDLDEHGNVQLLAGDVAAKRQITFEEIEPPPRGTPRLGALHLAINDLEQACDDLRRIDHTGAQEVAERLRTVADGLRRIL